MYAVIRTGGKQYKVKPGAVVRIEKLEVAEGSQIDFNEVLMVTDGSETKVGTPIVAGGKVTAIVQAQGRDKKVTIIKFKRRKHHRKQMGHRQYYTDVKITEIQAEGLLLLKEPVEVTQPTVVLAEKAEPSVPVQDEAATSST